MTDQTNSAQGSTPNTGAPAASEAAASLPTTQNQSQGQETGQSAAPSEAQASAEAAAAPTPEQAAAAAARLVVPTGDASYAVTLSDTAKTIVPLGDKDPAVVALAEGFKERGLTQGDFDAAIGALDVLQSKGILAPPFDPAAEVTKLGEGGQTRQADCVTFAQALLQRGDLDAEEAQELISLSPTAAGVRLIEKMRKMMTNQGAAPQTGGAAAPANGKTAEQAEADALRQDPKYGKDTRFTRDADTRFVAAYSRPKA